MTLTYEEASSRLYEAQDLLNKQDINDLPKVAQIRLLEAQRFVYVELQMLEAARINSRLDEYQILSDGMAQSEVGFRAIHDWAAEAGKTGQTVEYLFKGLSLILSLF